MREGARSFAVASHSIATHLEYTQPSCQIGTLYDKPVLTDIMEDLHMKKHCREDSIASSFVTGKWKLVS